MKRLTLTSLLVLSLITNFLLVKANMIAISERMINSIMGGDIKELEVLLKYFPFPLSNSAGEYPLNIASYYGNETAVNLMLDHGISAETPNKVGENALMSAAFHNHGKIIKKLIEKGANPNARDWYGQVALHWAVCYKGYNALQEILSAKADLNIKDNFGVTPAEATLHFGDMKALGEILSAGSFQTTQTPFGELGLMAFAAGVVKNRASYQHHPAYPFHLSPLQELIRRSPKKLVLQELKQNPSGLFELNSLGMDATMFAVMMKRYDVVPELIANSPVDCKLKDKFGLSHVDYIKPLPAGRLLASKIKCL